MRKHRSSTTAHYDLVYKKLRELMDARIDAATVEYAELLMTIDDVDFADIERRISEARQGGFPPQPKWRSDMKTVSEVPAAKGNFTW